MQTIKWYETVTERSIELDLLAGCAPDLTGWMIDLDSEAHEHGEAASPPR